VLIESRNIAQALGSAELDGHGQYGRGLQDDSRMQWPPDGPPHSSSVPPPFICNWGDPDCLGPGLGPKMHDDSDMQHRQESVPPDDLAGTLFARLACFSDSHRYKI
jgi:hypothetical protein